MNVILGLVLAVVVFFALNLFVAAGLAALLAALTFVLVAFGPYLRN